MLDGLAEEEIDDHGELGADAVGMSPLVTSAGGKVAKVDDLPNWFLEIIQNRTYDKNDLLAALVNQIFPCIACSDHKNVHNPSTWLPIFLQKSSRTAWELFDTNFGEVGPWNGMVMTVWEIYVDCITSAPTWSLSYRKRLLCAIGSMLLLLPRRSPCPKLA